MPHQHDPVSADGDDTVAFAVTVPEAPPGNADDVTSLFVNWYDIPGYDDGRTALDIPLNLQAPTIILRGPTSVEDGESCALSWETMAITELVLSITMAETWDLPALPAVMVTLDKPELMNCTSYLAALRPPTYLTVTYTLTHYHVPRDCGEAYDTPSSQGILLLQTRDGETREVEIASGICAFIPPDWAHRSIPSGPSRRSLCGSARRLPGMITSTY